MPKFSKERQGPNQIFWRGGVLGGYMKHKRPYAPTGAMRIDDDDDDMKHNKALNIQ